MDPCFTPYVNVLFGACWMTSYANIHVFQPDVGCLPAVGAQMSSVSNWALSHFGVSTRRKRLPALIGVIDPTEQAESVKSCS